MRPDQPSSRGALLRYLPALDGLRAIALGAVLLDHADLGIAPGGFLGVTVFFVLSGFLITALLLRERDVTGAVDLRAFWIRRARRLVPAALLFIGVAAAYLLFGSSRPPAGVFGDGVATLTWVANWRFVLEGRSYGDLFSDPTPFQHVWSLAVEEQFYLGLPLVAIALLGLRGTARRGRFAIGVAAVIALSTAAAWILHDPGAPPVRAYYGTDARIAELAVGVLLAIVLVPNSGLRRIGIDVRRAITSGAVIATALLVGLIATVEPDHTFLYRGGFLLTAIASAALVAAATQPGLVSTALRWRPLVAAGRVTYGAYLFHWPIFLWLTEGSTGLSPVPLLLVRCAATFGVAAMSYRLLEQPVRKGRLGFTVGGLSWANGSIAALAVLFAVSTTATPVATTLFAVDAADAEVAPPPTVASRPTASVPPSTVPPGEIDTAPATTTPTKPATTTPPRSTTRRAAPTIPTGPATPPPPPPTTVPASTADPVRIAVVGDSLAQNLAGGMLAWAEGRDDAVVYDLTMLGCPISRGGTRRIASDGDFPVREGCRWWSDPSTPAYGYLMEFQPDVVVLQDAINEIPDRFRAAWNDYRRVGDSVFDSWIDGEYAAFFGAASDWGADRVLLLNAPCVDWSGTPPWNQIDDGEGRRVLLNDRYDSYDGDTVTLEDLDSQICPDGRFTTTVMGVEDARPDGFHLTEAAAREVATRWLGPLAVEAGRR
jgi:peptidoglycan/LPS O-acetylase OafA/YrhL